MAKKLMMMVAALAATFGAWAANVTLSFNASGGTQSTSQFSLGKKAQTFDRTTIPSWITSLTLHQSIEPWLGNVINNTYGLTPAVGTLTIGGYAGSGDTCTIDVTVAKNTGVARSWTMNICKPSDGSVVWSMLVTQPAGYGGVSTSCTVTFNPNGGTVGETSRLVVGGTAIGALPTPVRDGYVFDGWWTGASMGMKVAASTIVEYDINIYAHWIAYGQIVNGYKWGYESGANGLTITSCSPKTEGAVVIPSCINGMNVEKLGDELFCQNAENVETFVIQNGIKSLGNNAFEFPIRTEGVLKDMYMPPSVTSIGNFALRFFEGATLHWTVGAESLDVSSAGFGNFFGNLDITALGGVPDGMVKYGLYGWDNNVIGGKTTFRCKRAYYDEWNAFFDGSATFLGYIDEDYTYSPPVSTITFDLNGGFAVETQRDMVVGASFGSLPVPVKDGYAFAGWWTDADGGERIDSTTTVNNDMTCHAHWAEAITVMFNANGGNVAESSRLVVVGGEIGELPLPVRDGWIFAGWWTAVDGGERVSASTIAGHDATYYAHWDCGYVVSFDANGGVVSELMRRVVQGGAVGTLPLASRSGFSFDGWFTARTGGVVVTAKTTVGNDVTYYAHWSASPYVWTYTGDASTGLTITGVSPQPSGFVEIPAALDGMPVVTLGAKLFFQNDLVTTVVVPQGVQQVGVDDKYGNGSVFEMSYSGGALRDVYLPPSVVRFPGSFSFRYFRNAVLHMTVDGSPLSFGDYSFANFYGTLDVSALGAVPENMVKFGLYQWNYKKSGQITTTYYRCKQAYKEEWDAFFAGTDAEFLGYIDDDYEYLDPIFTIEGGVLIAVQLMGGRDVVIPDGVTSIGPNAFAGNTLVRSVMIPASVTAIAPGAFTGCTGLESIAIPYSLDTAIAAGFPSGVVNVEIVFTGDGMTTGGDAEWGIDTTTVHGGMISRRSGAIGNDEESWIEMETQNPGRLSFWWKASSESDGDLVFDYAYLSIDGVVQGTLLTANDEYQLEGVAIGGKTGWQNVVLDVTGSGAHTIRWTYCKDEVDEGDTGEDCVWLDDVEFTPLVSVTFDLGDGTGTAPAGFAEMAGTVVTLPDQSGFDLADYVFDGWSDGTTLYLAGASYSTPYGDVTLTAQWIKKTFLTFDLGGGTGTAPEVVKELRGTVVTLPDQSGFDLADYVFEGWSDGTTTYASGANYTMPSEDVTLTAQWIKKTFLTFDLGGGTGTAPEVVKELHGTVVALPVQSGFDRTDYVFDGWNDGTDTYSAGASYTMPSEDVTLTAQWIEKRFLTFTIDGGEGTVPVTIKDIPGAVVTLPTAEGFSKPKHTFVGWSDGTRTYLAGENYVIGAEGIAFTAVWLPNELDIEISSSDVSDGGTNDAQGATISISAFAKEHESWAVDKRLLHRWSFNGDPIDSAGGATAQIVGNVTTDGTQYTTHYGSSGTSYIDLGDNLVPADAQAVTFEFWATLQESAYWARVFDFGSMTSEGYDFAVLDFDKESKDSLRMYWKDRTTDHVFDAYGWTMNEGTEYHIAVSYAPGGDGIWVATYYVQPADGSDVAYVETQPSGDPTWSFASVGQTEWLLGQALTTWDTTPGISYNEVRIWQAAMDEETFLANTAGGANATLAIEAEIDAGDETIAPAIYYTLDGSEPTTNSTRYVEPFFADDLGDVTVKAIAVMDNYFDSDVVTFTFTRLPYSAAECIGDPELTVTTGGDAAWSRVLGEEAHDGVAAMRSGAIGDSQSSYVEMQVERGGEISFWWKISSQNKVRTNKHDYLAFSVDGEIVATLGGGAIDWTNETYSVECNESHTLRWTYLKDGDGKAANDDCAWLDEVVWTPAQLRHFTVAFDANGGSVGETEREVTEGEQVGELPVPTRDGYTFVGWFTAADDGDEVMADTIMTDEATFYAQWDAIPLAVGDAVTWKNTGTNNAVWDGDAINESNLDFMIPATDRLPAGAKVRIKSIKFASLNTEFTEWDVTTNKSDPYYVRLNGVNSEQYEWGGTIESCNGKFDNAVTYRYDKPCYITVGKKYSAVTGNDIGGIGNGIAFLHSNGKLLYGANADRASVRYVNSGDRDSIISTTSAATGYYPVYEIEAEVVALESSALDELALDYTATLENDTITKIDGGWFNGATAFDDGSRLSSTDLRIGPYAGTRYVLQTTSSATPYKNVAARTSPFSFALYADVSAMPASGKAIILEFGNNGSNMALMFREGDEVKLGFGNKDGIIGTTASVAVRPGYHLYTAVCNPETGYSRLRMDGGSESAGSAGRQVSLGNGFQIASVYYGIGSTVYSTGANLAIAKLLGYQAEFTEKDVAALAALYPAVESVVCDVAQSGLNGKSLMVAVGQTAKLIVTAEQNRDGFKPANIVVKEGGSLVFVAPDGTEIDESRVAKNGEVWELLAQPQIGVQAGENTVTGADGSYIVTGVDGKNLSADEISVYAMFDGEIVETTDAYIIEVNGTSATVKLKAPEIAVAAEQADEVSQDDDDPAGVLVVVDDSSKVKAKPVVGINEEIGAIPVKGAVKGLWYRASWGADLQHLVDGESFQADGGQLYLGVIKQNGSSGFYKLSVSEK